MEFRILKRKKKLTVISNERFSKLLYVARKPELMLKLSAEFFRAHQLKLIKGKNDISANIVQNVKNQHISIINFNIFLGNQSNVYLS